MVTDVLLSRILRGTTTTTDKLDERVIGREFGSARAAVRGALNRLTVNGLLRRAPRTGTTPTHDIVREMPYLVTNLRGATQRCRTLSMVRTDADPTTAELVEVAPGAPVTRIERAVDLGDRVGQHWTILSVLDPAAHFGAEGLPEERSWYEIEAALLGQDEFTVERRWTVVRAAAEDAELLDVEVGAPISFVDRVIRDGSGRLLDRSFGRTSLSANVVVDHTRVTVDPASGTTTSSAIGVSDGG